MPTIYELVAEEIVADGIERDVNPKSVIENILGEVIYSSREAKVIKSAIYSGEWKVPLSFMERMALKWSKARGNFANYAKMDNWLGILNALDISYECLDDENEMPIPPEVREKIEGKIMNFPTLIDYKGERYLLVAVSMDTDSDESVEEGEKIQCANLESLYICPLKYFDLNS